jgi:tetraacyldisaccharide 4'-kinase
MHVMRVWSTRNGLTCSLWPLSLAYRFGAWLREATVRPYHPSLPLLCIGNAMVGGAGKTPTVRYLAQKLTERNVSVAILSRGYGGTLHGPVQVDTGHNTSADVGDEPLLLAQDAEVWISRSRVNGVKAIERTAASLVLMDDGLQNHTLAPNTSLLVVDGGYGIGNGFCLPAGPLREPWEHALAKAEAVLIIGEDRHSMAGRCGNRPVLRGWLEPQTAGLDLAGGLWLAFAGIGRPAKFFETLAEAGANVAETASFPDHHPYRLAELQTLAVRAEALGARLITTEKDAVRLPSAWRSRVAVLPVRLRLDAASEAWLDDALDRWLTSRHPA